MDAFELYDRLESDFITPEMTDDWAADMGSVAEYVCGSYRKRSMGLVCDFSTEIRAVFTAVFPSSHVMSTVLGGSEGRDMLFVHHPMVWDIRVQPNPFLNMDPALLDQFRDKEISIYNLHVPLDHYGDYSTSVTFARAVGVRPFGAFRAYYGALAGVFGKTICTSIRELKRVAEVEVSHACRLYAYGEDEVRDSVVAILAGGGNDIDTLDEARRNEVNTLLTGITVRNDYSEAAHAYAERHRMNILGATHYSTEKYACIALTSYFKKRGLSSELIDDVPIMGDL